MKRRSWFTGSVTGTVIAFLYLPLVLVTINAFNADENLFGWGGFTLRWFKDAFGDDRVQQDFRNSVTIAVISTILALVVAVGAASWARKATPRQRMVMDITTYTRMVLPEIVLAIALFIFFRQMDLPLGKNAIIVGHAVFNSAYATVVIQARMATMGLTLEQAASDLGATPWRSFRRVTLPQLWPAIAGAGLLAFTFSLDNVIMSSNLAGGKLETLPVYIFSLARFQVSPLVNAIGVIVMVMTLLGFTLAIGLMGLRSGLLRSMGSSEGTT